MRERGYAEPVAATRVFVLEGEGVAFPLDLPLRKCTTAVAIGGGSLRELSAAVFDENGEELAADAVPGEAALVHVCPESDEVGTTTAPHYLAIQSQQGTGAALVGAFVSEPGAGQGFEDLFAGVVAPAEPFESVVDELSKFTEALRERGLHAEGEPEVARVPQGGRLRLSAQLRPGECYVAAAAGSTSVRDVDLFLFDDAGAELARDLDVDRQARVEYCPEQQMDVRVEAQVFEGAGTVAIQLFGGATLPPQSIEPATPVAETFEPLPWLLAHADELRRRGYGEPVLVVRDAEVGGPDATRHEVSIGPGCAVFIGAGGTAGGRGEIDLDLYLSKRSGGLEDRDTRVARTALVGACSEEAGLYDVSVKAYGRGRYVLARLAAPVDVLDLASLRIEPLRALEERRGLDVTIHRERLDAEQPSSFFRTLPVPREGCVAVVAAGGRGIDDLDLLLRAEDGSMVASDTGPAPWATLRRCVSDDDVPPTGSWELDLRVYRGAGPVLLEWMSDRL